MTNDTTSKVLSRLRFWLSPKAAIYRVCQQDILGAKPEEYRIFIDRGSNILFTAHLDTVKTPKYYKKNKNNVWAAGLDDRLGCAVATTLGEELGADVLLCDREESGKSTGYFHDLKEYNWIVEFDREGGDVVTYDLDSVEFLAALNKYWYKGIGSFTDIVMMNTSCCCMNLGIGTKYSHSENSYVNKKQLRNQIDAFKEFYSEYKDVKFKQDYRNAIIGGDTSGYGFSQRQYGYNYGATANTYAVDYGDDICDFCGMVRGQKIFNYHACEDCFDSMLQ